jgi:hypothetical protein
MAEVPETPEMMFETGKRFYLPSSGVADPLLALYYFTKSAEAGYVPAQRVLGTIHLEGRLASLDYGEAHKWLSTAARHNDGQAVYQLALMYVKGLGIARDWALAWKLLDMECARSLADARDLKEQMRQDVGKPFPEIKGKLAEVEKKRRIGYTGHRQRFIQPWDTPHRPQLAKEEFEVWLKLNLGTLTPDQALAELTRLLGAYYAEQETIHPSQP